MNKDPLDNILDYELPEFSYEYVSKIKDSINTIREAWETIDFSNMIQLIDYLFETKPIEFTNGSEANKARTNLWSLKILTLGLMLGLNTNQILSLFGEHLTEVENTPKWDSHKNIRALRTWGYTKIELPENPFTVRI